MSWQEVVVVENTAENPMVQVVCDLQDQILGVDSLLSQWD